MLKGLQKKKYPFPDSDLSGMLDDLLEKVVIELLESKRSKQVRRVTNVKYCQYHKVISNPLEKCITITEYIMQLARDAKIILDLDGTLETYHISTGVFFITLVAKIYSSS